MDQIEIVTIIHDGENKMTLADIIKAVERIGVDPSDVRVEYGNCGSHVVEVNYDKITERPPF